MGGPPQTKNAYIKGGESVELSCSVEHMMSGYRNFAIVGAGTLGNYIIRQFLKEKAAGTINEVVVLSRQVSSITIQ
jgi:ornithine cyclodeaminase/alanine dehydrogenase-like protein (mu-crystallin family)